MVYTFTGPFIQVSKGLQRYVYSNIFILQLRKSKARKIKAQTFKHAFGINWSIENLSGSSSK